MAIILAIVGMILSASFDTEGMSERLAMFLVIMFFVFFAGLILSIGFVSKDW